MSHQSEFMKTIHARGMVHQCTDMSGFDALLAQGKPIAAYIGFDCTATSLHVGSLIQIMMLRRFQQAGHKPIILMGGGTTKVGDPSGKDKSRPPLTDAQIAANMEGIKQVFTKFIKFGDGPTDAIMVNNDDWLSGLKYIEFLRDFGRHFSINRMLTMDSVKLRLEREQPLSFLEFNYMILQGYDFYHLAKPNAEGGYNCKAQFGGSDQWGNIVNGVELHRRKHHVEQAEKDFPTINTTENDSLSAAMINSTPGHRAWIFGLTTPLFTNAAGDKMGKTADGAVWLNADLFKPYDYWQFWRNAEDAMVRSYLLWFTDLCVEEIDALASAEGAAINESKKRLATEATAMLHGREAAEAAAATAQKVFEQGGVGDDLPEITLAASALDDGLKATVLFTEAKLTASNGEAKKLIEGGGAKLNDAKISDIHYVVTKADLNAEGFIKLSAGKKKHALVKLA